MKFKRTRFGFSGIVCGPEWETYGRASHQSVLVALFGQAEQLPEAGNDILRVSFFQEIGGRFDHFEEQEGVRRRTFETSPESHWYCLAARIRIPYSRVTTPDEGSFRTFYAGLLHNAAVSLDKFRIKKGIELACASVEYELEPFLNAYLDLPLPIIGTRQRSPADEPNEQIIETWFKASWETFMSNHPGATEADRQAFSRQLLKELRGEN